MRKYTHLYGLLTKLPMTAKNRKITVLLEKNKFDRFSDYCESQGYKKSTLICKLITDLLNKEENDRDKKNYD